MNSRCYGGAVAFSGATGFAVGNFGTVVRSVDGGATWTGLPSGTINDLSVVQEVNPNAVIVGGGCTVRESDGAGEDLDPPEWWHRHRSRFRLP